MIHKAGTGQEVGELQADTSRAFDQVVQRTGAVY
jgi:hypothetical protein